MRLIAFAIYIAVGAMLHALVIGGTFDWSSAWTLAWLFGWPIMLVATFGAVIVFAAIAVGLAWAAWEWLKTYANWRAKSGKSY